MQNETSDQTRMNRPQGHDRLMEQITSPENLLAAWRSVRGNVPRYRRMRSAGPDGVSLVEFEQNLSAHLGTLRHALIKGSYAPQPPAVFKVNKPNGGQRQLAVLNVADRVAQRAAQQVLEPLWEPTFLPCSFGFRPGRSTRDAIDAVRGLRGRGNQWLVDGDISACFDSLNHHLLIRRIEYQVRDVRVIELLNRWIEQGILEYGLPQAHSNWLTDSRDKITGGLRRGAEWVSGAANIPADDRMPGDEGVRYPYAHRLPNLDEFDPGLYDEGEGSDYRLPYQAVSRQQTVQQVLAGALMVGSGWVRPAISRLAAGVVSSLKTTAGRDLLKKGALAGGGVVGAALGVGAATWLLYREVAGTPGQTGILQGSPLSPLLANIYLHAFDVQMTQAGFQLVRFADDWVICCPSELVAERAYNQAVIALSKIQLKVNVEKTRILPPNEALNWLGERVPPNSPRVTSSGSGQRR